MSTKQFTNAEIGALRDESANLLGKSINISGLELPQTCNAERCIIETKKMASLIVSRVELYPHLVDGTPYKKRFDNADRTAGRTFTFQAFGAPAVAIVLPNQQNAIAVIKRAVGNDGNEKSWMEILQQLGADRSQFQYFLEVADNIDTKQPDAHLRLEDIPEFENVGYDITEHPNVKVKNLDAVLQLSSDSRRQLRNLMRGTSLDSTSGQHSP